MRMLLKHSYQVCQMLNTKKPLTLGVLNAKIFGMSEQYNFKNENVRTEMVKVLIFFILFSLSSLITLFFFLSSLILPQTSNLSFFLFSLFFLLTLVAFLSSSQPRRATSSTWCRSLLLWFFFFFFSKILWVGSAMGGFRWW